MTAKIVSRAGAFLERRTSRRGFLARVAYVGAAASLNPLRVLLQPESAWALAPSQCSSTSRCRSGYTEFCCSNVGFNGCPSYTFIGGYWKCTSYTGGGLCDAQNVRYYVDCNLGETYGCNCVCSLGTCDCR